MAQQPQPTSQLVLGPANGGGDIIHFIPTNANVTAPNGNFLGWIDNNNAREGVQGVTNGLANNPAATVTAATGGIFQNSVVATQLNLYAPGNSRYEQLPFTVKAAGYVQMGAGTYTATVQPLIYALIGTNTAAAVAANAIYSAAAISVTVSSATAKQYTWEAEVNLIGDSVSGHCGGFIQGRYVDFNGTNGFTALAISTNNLTGVIYNTATPPALFAAGVTLTNPSSVAVASVLGSFFIES